MKPSTKKTLIIVLAVAVVAVIVYFAFFRKKGASSIVDRLDITPDQKAALKAKIAEIEANTGNVSGWTKDEIERKAAANGYTYQQYLVVEAAYALYYNSDWALFERIGLAAKSL